MENLKVIFHIDQADKWNLVLTNTRNFYEGCNKCSIVILANGEAVKGYSKDSDFEDEMHLLSGWDVEFLACRNALNAFDVKESSLMTMVDIVPAGVIELVLRQNQGYRYIKP